MRRVRLGRTNVQVPAVSLGTWSYGGLNSVGKSSVGWGGHDDALALQALREAYQAGITHWDTADVYGDGRSEALIGQVWGDVPRDDVFLATKVGWDNGEFDHPYHPDLIRARIDRSLENLQTDVIDLYYLHHSNFGKHQEHLDDAVATLREARDAGKIRFIGLSDWSSEKVVAAIERVDPDVVQPYRNVCADTYASSGLKAWVEEHDVGLAFFSPIRHGLLLGKYDAPVTFESGDFRTNVKEFGDAEVLAELRAKAEALREKFADRAQPVLEPLLGAILADAPTACVLLGQRNPDQVRAAANSGAALSAEEAAWVMQTYAELRA